jgi:hypothetical protein
MNTLSVGEKIKEDLMPALISAGCSLLGYSLAFGESPMGYLPFFGSAVPAGVVVGGSVFSSHLIGNVLENNVLSMIGPKVVGVEHLAKPVISGLSTYGIFKFGVSNETAFLPSFGLGAGSVLAGEYVSDTFHLKKN